MSGSQLLFIEVGANEGIGILAGMPAPQVCLERSLAVAFEGLAQRADVDEAARMLVGLQDVLPQILEGAAGKASAEAAEEPLVVSRVHRLQMPSQVLPRKGRVGAGGTPEPGTLRVLT